MRAALTAALAFMVLAMPHTISGQELIDVTEYCLFDGGTLTEQVYGFASDQDAQSALQRVLEYTGLEPNFVIKAGNVPNAMAAMMGPQRLIIYNQQFMLQVRDRTRTDWSLISILAHEIGHHLQGHSLLQGGSRPPIELEADKFSGFVLQRMGATLEEAQAAMNLMASDRGSPTHPGKQARLAAITNGWIKARELSANRPAGGAPSPTPKPQTPTGSGTPGGVGTPTGPATPTYVARAVFPADPVAYYVLSTDDIVGISPESGQPVLVGKRMAPSLPGFAWMYSTPYITYGVTPDGRIMNRDQFGNAFQVGHIAGIP